VKLNIIKKHLQIKMMSMNLMMMMINLMNK